MLWKGLLSSWHEGDTVFYWQALGTVVSCGHENEGRALSSYSSRPKGATKIKKDLKKEDEDGGKVEAKKKKKKGLYSMCWVHESEPRNAQISCNLSLNESLSTSDFAQRWNYYIHWQSKIWMCLATDFRSSWFVSPFEINRHWYWSRM